MTCAPDHSRGGAVSTVDGKRWFVTLLGAAGDLAPTDEAGFHEFARSLRDPEVADVIAKATPATPIYRVANLHSRWTHYHRLPTWPGGLVAIADSVCSLNPVYGHGMTLAALESVMLGKLLEKHKKSGDLSELGRKFQRRIARLIATPWMSTTSTDLGWQPESLPLSVRLSHWYLGNILDVIPTSASLYARFMRISHMVDGPAGMLHPTVVLTVIANALGKAFRTRLRGARQGVAPQESGAEPARRSGPETSLSRSGSRAA
jgi:hypothetical protein